ncbi:MAG: AMIN-like domain-containing (lipo)protein [Nocardioidaceae bacterium]
MGFSSLRMPLVLASVALAATTVGGAAPSSGAAGSAGPAPVVAHEGPSCSVMSDSMQMAAGGFATCPVVVRRHPVPAPRIVNLRVGRHASFDRVVVDLRGRFTGYTVRFVRHLTADPSGRPVRVHGIRFLSVALRSANAHDATGHNVYRGPRRQAYSFPTLRGVAKTGDFEGVVSFGLGLSHRAAFKVTELHGPNRLVIDLRH